MIEIRDNTETLSTSSSQLTITSKEMDDMEKAKENVIAKVETVSAVTQENIAASEEISSSVGEVATTTQNLSQMANKLANIV